MIRITILLIISFIFITCKKTVKPDVVPFVIETELQNKENPIWRAWALKDGSFVLVTEIYDGNTTTFHKYNKELKSEKTTSLPCRRISEPIFYDDGTFAILADYYNQTFGTWVLRLNNNLEVLQYRRIDFLIQSGNDIRYGESLTRLSNGNIIYACTFEKYPPLADKIVIFCIADIFTDTKPIWRVNPANYDGSWVNTLSSVGTEFYISGNDHTNGTESFVLKYDSSGSQIFKKSWPFFFDFPNLYAEKDHIIYQTATDLFMLDPSGTELLTVKIGEDWYTRTSPLIRKGNYYFYAINIANPAGKFNEVRKLDLNLNFIKSIKLGNQRTNVNVWTGNFLLELTDGQLVSIMHIQNPLLSGNQWLIQKLTDNLEISN